MYLSLASIFSHFYRESRRNMIDAITLQQRRERRPVDLEEVVQRGDAILKKLPNLLCTFPIPEGIGVQFHDLYFPSPLTLAAFKDNLAVIDKWMRLGLGGACIKTVMKELREGTLRPRLQEVTVEGYDCLLNAMGLPGHGVEEKVQELKTSNIFQHCRPIGLSIGGNSPEEYQHVFDRLNACVKGWYDAYIDLALIRGEPIPKVPQLPYYFEINISYPNTPEGQQMAKHPELLERLVTYMRTKNDRVIGVKLSPDSADKELVAFAELMMRHGKTYVNLGNTTFRTCHEVGLDASDISKGGGGLSGPALYERTKQMIQTVAPTGIAICATGGIDSAKKVLELQEIAKANDIPLIVGMATAVVQDMYCIPKINRELAKRIRSA